MTLYSQKAPESIQTLFNKIAKNYDRTNFILSLGLHKVWNKSLVREAFQGKHCADYLDLCAGTGEIGSIALNKQLSKKTTLLDFSEEMLRIAKERLACDATVNFIQADALATGLPSEAFDVITMAYGLRNLKSIEAGVTEAARLLKPQGTFAILELTRPKRALLRLGHKLFLKGFISTVGAWLSGERAAYKYLAESVSCFVDPEAVAACMRSSGLENVRQIPLSQGIATLIIGSKPNPPRT